MSSEPTPVGGAITEKRRSSSSTFVLVAIVFVIGIVAGWVLGSRNAKQGAAAPAPVEADVLEKFIDGDGGTEVNADEGFSAKFPATPARTEELVGKVNVTNYSIAAGPETYSVLVFDYPAGEPIPEDLEELVDVVAQQNNADVDDVVPHSGGFPSVSYRLQNAGGSTYTHGRYTLVERKLYQLQIVSPDESPEGWGVFADSFNFEEPAEAD